MNFSLNETEAMARKAARGAGYGWGLAEDTGKAVRWLCTQGLDGCAALAGLLPHTDGKEAAQISPRIDLQPWSARSEALCPIYAGAALADHAHDMPKAGRRLGPVRQPLLLLPFVAQIASQRGKPMALFCESNKFVTDGASVSMTRDCEAMWPWAQICPAHAIAAPTTPADRAHPKPEAWDVLALFAHRTYAPATDESRDRGAGAGQTDND